MSLVGTRPILPDELEQYELHHRARIAIKPGITGMWQVSGRSDITDFEEIVRLDTEYISEKYRLKIGLSGIIEGSLPIGGLSSSASVIICFLSALCKVNGIHLEPMEMILTAKAAENQYVGVSCGKLDQSCEVLSKKNHLLYLDTKDDSYDLIPTSDKMKPYKLPTLLE